MRNNSLVHVTGYLYIMHPGKIKTKLSFNSLFYLLEILVISALFSGSVGYAFEFLIKGLLHYVA